jgi:hypothetical protein
LVTGKRSASAHCPSTPEATAPRPCLLSPNTGSATPSGRGRDRRRPTLWATVASMMLRDARPLAGGATERAWASTERRGRSLLLYLAERQCGGPGSTSRSVDSWSARSIQRFPARGATAVCRPQRQPASGSSPVMPPRFGCGSAVVGASEGGGRCRILANRESGHGLARGPLPLLTSDTDDLDCRYADR